MAVCCAVHSAPYVGRGAAEQAPCPHAACQGLLQTLSHMFVACSVAAPVWDWVASIMACMPDCTRPPLTVSVLLADDSRVWKPPSKLQPLWLRLRLATLHALWCEAAKVRRGGPAVSARVVACRVLAYRRKLMLQHWSRVGMRRRDLGWLSTVAYCHVILICLRRSLDSGGLQGSPLSDCPCRCQTPDRYSMGRASSCAHSPLSLPSMAHPREDSLEEET